MLTIEQIAQNLMVTPDSPLAQEFFKKQFLKGFKNVSNSKGNFYLTPEDAKELASVGPIDNDLIIPGVDSAQIEANLKKYKEILSRKLTLEQAFELTQEKPVLKSSDITFRNLGEVGNVADLVLSEGGSLWTNLQVRWVMAIHYNNGEAMENLPAPHTVAFHDFVKLLIIAVGENTCHIYDSNLKTNFTNEFIEIESFKFENGCEKVLVDRTYSKIKIFPIFNSAQEEFLKAIFVDGSWSRIDRAIIATLNSKHDTLEQLFETYSNEIDD